MEVTYKGIEYKLLRATTKTIVWSIKPPHSIPIHGIAQSYTGGRAAAEKAIRKWIEENQENAR
jgi:hypothetical protein